MKELISYLIQMIAASGILYGYYHFVLRNKKFHRYNRFYLLSIVLISLLIPFINIPVYFTRQEGDPSLVLQTLRVFSSNETPVILYPASHQTINWFSWQTFSYLLYILIACIALLKIILSLKKIRTIIRNHSIEKLNRINFVNTDEPGTPFSFFRWLFWNRRIELKSEKGEQIFRHEVFHIEQKHSYDIVFMEMLTAVFWINPFFHLMKKELKAIHEFLADEFAVKENERWKYAELLLMQVLNTKNSLINSFFHNQIKRRIAMITSSSKPGYQYLRKLLVLPVAAIVVALFAFSYRYKSSDKTNNLNKTLVDTIPVSKKNIKEVTSYDTSHLLLVIDGKQQPDLTISQIDKKVSANDIESINVLKGDTAIQKYGTNGKNGAIEITTKQHKKPKIKEVTIGDTLRFPLVVNGVFRNDLEVSDVLKKINPKNTVTINLLDKEQAIKKYGDKGKYGATEIIIKQNKNIKPSEVTLTDTVPHNNIIFEKTEIEPSFLGGEAAWKRYLEKSLAGFNPAKNGAANGEYTVYVQFIVDTNGFISDVKTLTHHGYGMEEKVIEIIKKGPKWNPAMQNGRAVRAYKKQPVTFVIVEKDSKEEKLLSSNENNYDKDEVVVVAKEIPKLNHYYYFCCSRPITRGEIVKTAFYTEVKDTICEESAMKQLVQEWGILINEKCKNNAGCTSDLNYYFNFDDAKKNLDAFINRYKKYFEIEKIK